METIAIRSGRLSARISAQGGAIADAVFDGIPLLRSYAGNENEAFNPLKAGSFPLVPFGNRIEDNTFDYDGRIYQLTANTNWDRHYLHGDGWLQSWPIESQADDQVTLALESRARSDTPYEFRAAQRISVAGEVLSVEMNVTNLSGSPMPFGLGHHCFFPLTPETTLMAPADRYWTEKGDFLPDRLSELPQELDFRTARGLPDRWINNGFENWTGHARIRWPERHLTASLVADTHFTRFFLFRSNASFEPGFAGDYFCFEPMSHTANAHNLEGANGLVRLARGETLTTKFKIAPETHP